MNRISVVFVAVALAACVGKDVEYDKNLDKFAGCQESPGYPFGAHRQSYVAGAILPTAAPEEMDNAVRAMYDHWKSLYLPQGGPCGAGRYWVSTGMGDNSATDGDMDVAYALLLADKQWGSAGDIDYRGDRQLVDPRGLLL